MIHFALPIAIVAAIKAYFIAHGTSISVAAMVAGYTAHKKGEDIKQAAINAGAGTAAAQLLCDVIKKLARG